MSKISIYEVAPVPKLADKLVGTSVGGDPEDITYNFTLSELLNLFIPNIPGNTLQGVLDFGNTATQDIILNGTIFTTYLEVTDTATILDSFLTGDTHITGGLYDRLNSVGTAGQVLRSTGTQVEWYSVPTVIPDLQQVLTSGNTAVNNIILTGNLSANNAALLTSTISTSLTLLGTLRDGLSSVGANNQVLSSNVTGVRWVNLPVYSATSPLLYNSGTGVFSIQQSSASQDGYLSSADWITFDGKQTAITLTTTGNSGASTLVGSTINVPNYTLAGLGGVPQTRTLTINGVTYNLSADRSWTLATGVSSVSATTPLFSTGGVNPDISIQQSSSSLDGYLSSTDWLTFNSKQPAGNYITSLTGEATGAGPGAAAVTLSNAAVIGKLLTGLSITGSAITSSDSILTAFGKVQNQINGLIGGVQFQGVWNAATNTPTLVSSVGTQGYYYIVDVAGNTNLNGITDWQVGDWAIFNGSTWNKVDNTDLVTSVNGQVGAVSLTTDNIPEGATNLYYLDSRARAALSFAAGSGAYNSTTGVITIPTDNSQILNGAGYITLVSLSATSPLSYNNTTGAFSIQVANTTQNGYLSSTDWNTFNGKQDYLNGTGLVKSVAGVISYITDNSANWNTAYNDSIVSAAVTGTATKTLTLNQQDGGTITASWSDIDTGLTSVGVSMPSAFTVTNSPLTSNGTIAITGSGNTLQYVDGTGALQTFPSLTGYVPYTGATANVNLGIYNLTAASLIKNGGTSGQFLKADGSVDSSAYIVLGSLSATAPLSYNNTTGVFTISQSGASTNGYLSSTDWNTFNSKEPAIIAGTTLQYYRGDKTFQTLNTTVVPEGTNLYYLDSRARAAVSLTTVGSSGASTYNSTTGVFNIPDYGAALTGYVPTSRTLNINGTSYDLSADRSWSVGTVTSVAALTLGTTGTDLSSSVATGTTTPVITLNVPTASAANRGALSAADWSTFNTKVGGVTATSPLFSSGGSTPNITIQQSSGSQDGYLSSTDWTTFNNKQAAGNYITSLTGEATATGPGAAAVTLDNAAVTGKILTGVNITGGTVLSTDTILAAFGKLQNQVNGLIGGSIYQGTWNAATNTPTLTSSVGTQGYYYIVSVAGTTNLDGITDWFVGDWAIFNGGVWQQVDNTDAVVSVNGQTGAVSLTTDNIPEGTTNLYYTDTRARASLSFVAGSGAYNSSTGAITIPTNTSQLTNGANFITLASLSGTAPISYNSGTGAISITQSGTASNGYLSSTDWNTFNNKQAALTNPVLASGTWTSNYIPKINGTYTLTNSLLYDGGSSIGVNTNAPHDSTQFKLDVNGGLIVKNTSGTTAQFVLIDANPAGGGNNAFVQQTVGGTLTAAWSQIQTYYGLAIAAGALRLQPTAGQVLVGTATASAFMVDINGTLRTTGQLTLGSTITNGTYTYTLPGATGTLALVGGSGVGTVTSVSFTLGGSGTDLNSSVANSTTTPAITLNVPTASATNRGALSAADWTTFNNKQATLSLTTTGTSGAATLVGATLNIPNYGSALSGYLPLTGGTLTGDLTITKATIVANVVNATDTSSYSYFGNQEAGVLKTYFLYLNSLWVDVGRRETLEIRNQVGQMTFYTAATLAVTIDTSQNTTFAKNVSISNGLLNVYNGGAGESFIVNAGSTGNAIGIKTRTGNDYAFFNWKSVDGSELLAESYIQRTAASTATLRHTINNGTLPAIYQTISSTGTITFNTLAGTGTRMVVADANGLLSTQAIPSASGVTGSGTLNKVAKFTATGSVIGDSIITATSDAVTITSTLVGPMFVLEQATASAYSQMRFFGDTQSAYIFKGNSTYTSYGGTNALNFYTDAGSGAGGFAFHPQGTQNAVFIDNVGNLGIGVGNSPTAKLDIAGGNAIIANNNNGGAYLNIRNNSAGTGAYSSLQLGNDSSNNRGGIAMLGSGWTTTGVYYASGLYLYTSGAGGVTISAEGATGSINFATNNTLKGTMLNSGFLGLNEPTPTNLLHLAGASATPSLRLASTSTGYYWDIGRENATTGDFVFNYKTPSTSSTEMVRIDTAGRFGIGVTPSGTYGKLTVAGGIRTTADSGSKLEIGRYNSGNPDSYIKLGSTSNRLIISNATDAADIFYFTNTAQLGVGISPTSPLHVLGTAGYIANFTTGTNSIKIYCGSTYSIFEGNSANQMGWLGSGFYIEAGATPVNRFNISAAGLTTITGELTLTGGGATHMNIIADSLYAYTRYQGGANDMYLLQNLPTVTNNGVSAGAGYLYFSQGQQFEFVWSGVSKVQITSTGQATFAADVIAYSDISVKENIRTINNALGRIIKSRGVLYDRIDTKVKDNIGFIAQELELQFPELISVNADGTKGVKYQNAVAVLFEAIKEQQNQIDELKKQVA
jgi:hypothetical protein